MLDADDGFFRYEPDGEVLNKFFCSRQPVSIIQGPVGSGTSTACCHYIWCIANEQQPDPRGLRKTRWYVVRNTFDELKRTTLKTWIDWFVKVAMGAFGDVKMSNPPEHNILWDLPDGTRVDLEITFLSLDKEEDVRKLLSAEVTGVWFNEVQFADKKIFDAAHARAMQGRYPPVRDGGPTWKGVIGDLNAPEEGHFIPYMRGDVPLPLDWDDDQRREYDCPDDWAFFVQPPGLIEVFENGKLTGYEENPAAENQKWVQESYLNLIKGKSKRYIDTYVMNRVGLYMQGKPVFESFVPETHVSKTAIPYRPEFPLVVGLDFARAPAAAICQMVRGQFLVLDEFGMTNVAADTFAPRLKERLMQKFPASFTPMGGGIAFYGDPTGDSAGQGTDLTPYSIFQAHGMSVIPAPGNNSIALRLNAVESLLNKMVMGGPAFMVDPHVVTIKAGMGGAYHFKKVQGTSRYHDKPEKDKYSDFCDAVQYAVLGAGVGIQVLSPRDRKQKERKQAAQKKYSLKRRRR